MDDFSSATTMEESMTQPVARPLAGVIAYVDVRSGTKNTINIGQGLEETLENLGASIATRLTKDVTHIIYKDGKCNLDRIDSREVFLVNPLWLDSCKRCNERVSEAKYPVLSEGPGTPVVLGKVKRVKSIQPKPFEEEQISHSVERKRKRIATKDGNLSAKKKPSPIKCPFDFLLTDDEEEEVERVVIDSSQESTPDNLPTVSFTKGTPGVAKKTIPNASNGKTKTKSSLALAINKKKSSKLKRRSNKLKDIIVEEQSVSKVNKSTDKRKIPAKLKINNKKTGSSKAEDKENTADTDHTPDSTLDVKPKLRTSTNSNSRKRSSFEKQKPSIVMTSVPQKDQEIIISIVNKLGGFEFSNVVKSNTSHVICGANRRTINVLAGSAKGCWILSVDWVLKSLESGHWLPEGAFEMITEFPSAQFFRLERHQAGLLYKPSLFLKAGSIYISKNTRPLPTDLELLLNIAGSKITSSKLKADVIVGKYETEKVCVSESWIIESVAKHSMLPFDEFLLHCNDSPEL